MICNKILVLGSQESIQRINQSMYMTDFDCVSTSSYQFNEIAELIEQNQISLVIVDLAREPLDIIGSELIKRLKAFEEGLVIVGLTPNLNNDAERIFLLTIGVDELLSSEFNGTELRLRISKRLKTQDRERIIQDLDTGLTLYPSNYKVKFTDDTNGEVTIELAQREFNVLSLMVQHPRRTWTRSHILESCWKDKFLDSDERLVDGVVYKLRRKVAPCQHSIKTIVNTGYQYCPA